MEQSNRDNSRKRIKRTFRVRKKLHGTDIKPRLSVVKTNKNVIVQAIDDENQVTLAATSTLSKEFRNTEFNKRNKESAKQLGLKVAEFLKAKKIKKVVFDRGRFKYHGVIAAVADGAREAGLEF